MCAASQSFRFRESRRLEHQAPVTLSLAGERGDAPALTRDIGEGGMFVCMPEPLPAGSSASFALNLGTDDAPSMVRGEATVVWVRDQPGGVDQPAGMGMRFTRLDGDGRDRVQAFFDQAPSSGTEMNLAATPAVNAEDEAPPAAGEGQGPEVADDGESAPDVASPSREAQSANDSAGGPPAAAESNGETAPSAASPAAAPELGPQAAPEQEDPSAAAATALQGHQLAGRPAAPQDLPATSASRDVPPASSAASADDEPVAEPVAEPEPVVTPGTEAGSNADAEAEADAEPEAEAGALAPGAAAPGDSFADGDEADSVPSPEVADAPADAGGTQETGNLAMGADLFGDSGADDWMKPDERPRWVWPTVAGVIVVGLLLFFLRGPFGLGDGSAPDQPMAGAVEQPEIAVEDPVSTPADEPVDAAPAAATDEDAASPPAGPQQVADAVADQAPAAAQTRPVESGRDAAAELSAPPPSGASSPESPTEPRPAAAAPANATALRAIRASVEGDRTVVEVMGNAPFVRHAVMTLDDPPRLLVRLPGVQLDFDASSVKAERLRGVRTGIHGRGATRQLHVVLDIASDVATEVERSGDRIVVHITDQP